jgi:hypothetical protein
MIIAAVGTVKAMRVWEKAQRAAQAGAIVTGLAGHLVREKLSSRIPRKENA